VEHDQSIFARVAQAAAAAIMTRPAPPVSATLKESTMDISRESLLDDFSSMLTEAEDLLRRAGNETGERAKDLRAQVEAKLLAAKLRLQELEGEAIDRAKAAARVTDDYVHDNPWRVIGVAAAAGFIVGLLVNRR
jgi:ElaB/YqjD/DUF883 family membrane-anchored ribosome-binding protein